MKLKLLSFAFLLINLFPLAVLLLPQPVLAEDGGGSGLTTNLSESVEELKFFQDDLGVFITNTVKVGIITGSIIALLFLIWGAIDWITSGGDKAKYEAARDKITAAIFGLGLLASAFVVWMLVNYFFGIDKAIQIKRNSSASTSYTNSYSYPNYGLTSLINKN